MKLVIVIFITVPFLWNCAGRETKQVSNVASKPILKFWDDSTNTFKLITDGKLVDAWENFKEALLKNNFEKLKSLSTDCVHCGVCNTNNYVQSEVFYRKFFTQIFDSVFLTWMNDTAKVRGHYDDVNWHIYAKDCISKSADSPRRKLAEIWVKVSDRDSLYKGFEGGDAAIAFIETASGYKFCGYSTIP